jgi:hypothetical protein
LDVAQTLTAFDSEYCLTPDGKGAYYVYNVSKPGTGTYKPLAFNEDSAMERAYLNMYLATGSKTYLDKTTKLAQYLKSNMTFTASGSVTWKYGIDYTQTDDLSHASLIAEAMYQSYRAGIVFTLSDVQAVAKSVLKGVVTNSTDIVTGWRRYLDGQGTAMLYDSGPAFNPVMYSYALLGQVNPTLASDIYYSQGLASEFKIRLLGPVLMATTLFTVDRPVLSLSFACWDQFSWQRLYSR